MNDREYKLTRPAIMDDHRHAQYLSHVMERVFLPVMAGKKEEARAKVAGMSGEQRGAALSLALDVIEALAARTPGMDERVESLWGDYLFAGWPDYDVTQVPRLLPADTDTPGETGATPPA
jgi:hypothetical protein